MPNTTYIEQFPSNFVKRGLVSSRLINEWSKLLSNIRGHGDVTVQRTKNGLGLDIIDNGFPWQDVSFGVTISADTDLEVTVAAGDFVTPAGTLAVSETAVAIVGSPTEASPHYVYAEWNPMGDMDVTPTIANNPLTTKPTSSGPTFRVTFCEVYLNNADRVVIGKRHHFGDVYITPIYVGDD